MLETGAGFSRGAVTLKKIYQASGAVALLHSSPGQKGTDMGSSLAVNGGPKTRTVPFPSWPVWDGNDEAALLAVLRSGKWGVLGGQDSRVREFGQAFAAYQGAKYGVPVVNGTVALRVALLAAKLAEGDEVIVPPYTFQATATAVVENNCVPVFVDVHPDSYNLDPALIEAAITMRTRAIIPVHFAGQAADMDRIMTIARRRNLIVIEDAAHAHGAEYKGRRLGSIGQMGCFSFQSSKNLTSGEGGIVITSDDRLLTLIHAIHNCGRMPDSEWYDHRILGMNYRLTEFQAALLLCGLKRLDEQTARRDANGRYLNAKLSQIPGIRPMPRGQGETRHSYHLYMFRYDAAAFGGVPRKRFLEALAAEGVPCSPGYDIPLYRQPFFLQKAFGPYHASKRPNLDYAAVQCPVCEKACSEEAVWLFQSMLLGDANDVDDIVRAISKVYDHREELR